jgi:hypothetical protein
MNRRFRPSTAAACALTVLALVAGARPAAAQRVSLTPTIGVYVPTADLFRMATGGTAETFKPEASIALGGRFGFWFGRRLGIEATGDYAPGQLKFAAGGQPTNPDLNTFTGSGRATFFIIPNTSPLYFSVTGGVGYVKRSGKYFDAHPEITSDQRQDWTGTAGATVGFRLGRVLHLHVSADDYIYTPKLAETDPSFEAKTQNDVHLSFGVGIPLLGLGK